MLGYWPRAGPLDAKFNVAHCAPKSAPVIIRLNNPNFKGKSVCSVIKLFEFYNNLTCNVNDSFIANNNSFY